MKTAISTQIPSSTFTYEDHALENKSSAELHALSNRLTSLVYSTWQFKCDQNYLSVAGEKTFVHRLRLLIDERNEVVGYLTIRGYELLKEGKRIAIFRGSAAILPECRGNFSLAWYFSKELFNFKWRHPFAKMYFIDTPIHPSSYITLMKNVNLVYPTIENYIPEKVMDVFEYVKSRNLFKKCSFPFEDPFLCTIPYSTFDSLADEKSWERKIKIDKYAKHFKDVGAMERNRGYVVIAPINLRNCFSSMPKTAFKFLSYQFKRFLKTV